MTAIPDLPSELSSGWVSAGAWSGVDRAEEERASTWELVALHSVVWLVLGNAVGLLLATLLLVPELGDVMAPFTYGRLMPIHLDLQLYGWGSVPLLGLLLRFYLPRRGMDGWARLAVGAWSGGLAFGAISWLLGRSSGKLFVDWRGPALWLFVAAMAILALVLGLGFMRQLREEGRGRGELLAKGLFLALLVAVPAVFYWAANPEVYPAINPRSGGATGGSLLGSTLGIVAVLYLAPLALGLELRRGGRRIDATALVLGLHFLGFALLDHGDHSHHEPLQIVALSSLLIWWPILKRHFQRFEWPSASRLWLRALAVWAILLLATGLVAFLPGVLERWKFTNALVAHAHVAMAGLVTSFNVLLLTALGRRTRWYERFARPGAFWAWHLGCGVLVASLLALGMLEAADPQLLFYESAAADALYGTRWAGGLAMLFASVRWLR